jgi:hypothetical protein
MIVPGQASRKMRRRTICGHLCAPSGLLANPRREVYASRPDEEGQWLLGVISCSARKMARLIEDLLTLQVKVLSAGTNRHTRPSCRFASACD